MKVLARKHSGYIIEATDREIAHLQGFYGPADQRENGVTLSEGDDINVDGLYGKLEANVSFDRNKGRIKQALVEMSRVFEEVDFLSAPEEDKNTTESPIKPAPATIGQRLKQMTNVTTKGSAPYWGK